MFPRACLGLLLLLSTYAWSQADTNSEATSSAGYDAPLRTPPPVNGEGYSTAFASETQSNTLRAGLTVSTAYSNNVLGGDNPVSSVYYSIWPALALDANTTRLHWVLNYSPGFTFYQNVSARNQSDQNVALNFQYRLSPHVSVSLQDSFQKTSNPFNQPNPLSTMPVSGSTPAPNSGVIAPIADQVHNSANAQVTYQLSADGMAGVGGTFTNLNYPNPAEAPGVYDSSSTGGSAFYSRRLLQKYDVGVSYQYMDILAYQAGGPSSTETQTQTIFLFCTIYLKPTLSLSLSGGPQHSDNTQPPLPPSRSWSPLTMASLSWRGQRTSLAASYSRMVTGGGGLAGAYHSTNANVSGQWQLSRAWTFGLSANYWLYKTLTPSFFGSSSGGHQVSGTASVRHPLGEHLTIQAGYTRIQQSSEGAAGTSTAPINQEFVSISYQFARPLKR